MGYKQYCRMAFKPDKKVTITTGIVQYEGSVISYEFSNSKDQIIMLQDLKEKNLRHVIPLDNRPSFSFYMNKEDYEKEEEDKKLTKYEDPSKRPK